MGHRNFTHSEPSQPRTQKLSVDTEPTEVILTHQPRAAQPSSQLGQPATTQHTPVDAPAPSGRMAAIRPSNLRQTRPSTWTVLQHLLALALTLGALATTIWFFVMTPLGQTLDELAFNEYAYQFLTVQPQSLQVLDQIPTAAGVFAVVGLIFVLLWKHRFVPALVGLAVALAANATTQILKNVIIQKPDYDIHMAPLNSAPSGHTTFAAAAVSMLFLASPKRLRPAIAVIGMLFTLAAGYSTIINGWHRPADVVAAILVTTSWTVLGLGTLRFLRSEELDLGNTQRSGLIMIPLLVIAGCFLGFCTVALYILAYAQTMSGSALMGATCLIACIASFSTAALIGLLRSQNKQRKAYTKVWTY
ncbi:phosphatase PAP2 family protein [Rothia sp. ZJ932]|uniref:phosphatase PAP2 family protein n=1 Tax=Rothia sp. ZJ932 TaxID=2810516 RepID=UPI00196719EA|nr:phosphatase PAP2 family protein [Rothia sp. ZJ932]QRZ62003.1 phosphatase PAP2 family protein [Rothia sp. ZJ932]